MSILHSHDAGSSLGTGVAAPRRDVAQVAWYCEPFTHMLAKTRALSVADRCAGRRLHVAAAWHSRRACITEAAGGMVMSQSSGALLGFTIRNCMARLMTKRDTVRCALPHAGPEGWGFHLISIERTSFARSRDHQASVRL